MAPSLGTAWIQIKPSMSGMTSAIRSELSGVENELEKSSSNAGKTNGKSWAESFAQNAAAAIIAGGAFKKISTAITGAINIGADFGSRMSQVASTLGYTTRELDDETSSAARTMSTLSNFAQDMGATTAFSAREAADALNYMALAGYDAQTSMKMLPTVLNLAAAGNMELATTSDVITDAQTALGLSLPQTNALTDQMARTASRSNTSVSQLGEAILTVGGNARYLSGGTVELNTVLGVLADNGVKGAQGGTALRNVLLGLAAPTKEGSKLLKQLGVNVFDASGNLRSFSEIFPDLNRAMADFTNEERMSAFDTLFNLRDIRAATALLETTTERWDELGTEITNSAGAAEAMAAVQLDNLAGDTILLESAWEGFQIALEQKLEPVLRTVTQALTNLIGWVGDNWAWLEPIFIAIISFLGTITAIFAAKTIFSGLSALFALVSANPVVLAIAGIIFLITELIMHFDEIKAAVETVFGAIGQIFSAFGEWVGNLFSGIWDTVVNIFSNIGNFFASVWETIASVFTGIGTVIGEAVSGAFKTVVNGILSFIEGFINTPINILNGFISLINAAFGWIGVNLGQIATVKLPRLATGGIVGGIGSDTSDSNLVMLSRGEYVIRASAARQIGYDRLDQMNERGEIVGGGGNNYFTINGYNKSPEELATIISRKIALQTQGVF